MYIHTFLALEGHARALFLDLRHHHSSSPSAHPIPPCSLGMASHHPALAIASPDYEDSWAITATSNPVKPRRAIFNSHMKLIQLECVYMTDELFNILTEQFKLADLSEVDVLHLTDVEYLRLEDASVKRFFDAVIPRTNAVHVEAYQSPTWLNPRPVFQPFVEILLKDTVKLKELIFPAFEISTDSRVKMCLLAKFYGPTFGSWIPSPNGNNPPFVKTFNDARCALADRKDENYSDSNALIDELSHDLYPCLGHTRRSFTVAGRKDSRSLFYWDRKKKGDSPLR